MTDLPPMPRDGYRIRYTDGNEMAWVANVKSAADLRAAEYAAHEQIPPRLQVSRPAATLQLQIYEDGQWYDPMFASLPCKDGEDRYEYRFRVVALTHDHSRGLSGGIRDFLGGTL